jgi:hypothetical protein
LPYEELSLSKKFNINKMIIYYRLHFEEIKNKNFIIQTPPDLYNLFMGIDVDTMISCYFHDNPVKRLIEEKI